MDFESFIIKRFVNCFYARDKKGRKKAPCKKIAESVGYSAVYQFSRAYKKYYGEPPSKA